MLNLKRLITVFRSLGLRAAVPYLLAERFRFFGSRSAKTSELDLYQLHPRDARYPVYCRRGTSDKHAFSHVFVEQEYAFLRNSCDPKTILDCGANVGFSAVYFMSQFPGARVISIEPNTRNFEMLQRNTAPYGDRVTNLNSAVWSRPTNLVVSEGTYRDGGDWSTQVRECRAGESPDLRAIDIGSVLEQFGLDRIDILKMDIERAELSVFSDNFESWINRVGVFLIELHDEQCQAAFFAALGKGRYEFSQSGELTVARRVQAI